MSKDLTQQLIGSLENKLDQIIATVQSLESGIATRFESLRSNLESRFASIDGRFEALDARIESMEVRIESIDSRLGDVESRLTSLETKIEERLKDTRPMWEAVQAQISDLKETLSHEIQTLRAETEKSFRVFDRQLEHYLGQLGRLSAYQRDLEERVDQIEKQSS